MRTFKLAIISILSMATAALAQVPVQKADLFPQNMLSNPGFENGTQGWVASGGATAAPSATAKGFGARGYEWDSNSAGQTLMSASYTIPEGLRGRNGVAFCNVRVPSGTATHTITVNDGTNDIGTPTTILFDATGTAFTRTPYFFTFPASGTLRVKLASVASNEPAIYVDDCYLGDAVPYLSSVSQATQYGYLRYDGGTNRSWSYNTAFGDPAADPDFAAPTVSGGCTAPATRIPQCVANNMPPGAYRFTSQVAINSSGTDINSCRLFDGTNAIGTKVVKNNNGTAQAVSMVLEGVQVYTTTANRTFTLQCEVTAGTTTTYTDRTNANFEIFIERFPSGNELGFRPDQVAWKVDASISGANPSLGTSAVTSYTEITNGSLTLTNNTGSGNIAAQIPCSATNSPSGTTCSAGNESVGVSFTVPRAGDVLACASFSWYAQTAAAAGAGATAAFNIVETATNAQTILQEGKSRMTARITTPAVQNMDLTAPFRVCGTFSFSTPGQKVLRLMYEQSISSSGVATSQIQGDADVNNGQRDIHWEVYPLNYAFPAPLLVGSVNTGSAGLERIERATVSPLCSSSPCTIARQSSSWITSITRSTTGTYVVNFAAGVFSSPPSCVTSCFDSNNPTTAGCAAANDVGTSTMSLLTRRTDNTLVDQGFNIICMGPR